MTNPPAKGENAKPDSGRLGPMLQPQIRNIGLEAAKMADLVFSLLSTLPDFPRRGKRASSRKGVPRESRLSPRNGGKEPTRDNGRFARFRRAGQGDNPILPDRAFVARANSPYLFPRTGKTPE